MDERKSKTLFIRNLPFNATNESLGKHFGDIGPLKQCFVVKNKDDDKCKGYGYVMYSLIEDAEKAKSQVTSLDGRKLYICYANKKKDTKVKKSFTIRKSSGNEESIHAETEKKVQFDDVKREDILYLKAKTLVVTGFQDDGAVDTTLAKLNLKNVSKTEHPVKDRNQMTAFIRFKSIRDLKIGQRKAEKIGLTAVQLSKENKIVPQKELKKARLIVRNLSFQCTENHLKEVFSKYGEVSEIKIPKQPNGKMLGFGFVQFTEVSAAEKALKGINSKMIRGRTVAVDWAVAKNTYEKAGQSESDDDSSEGEDVKSSSDESEDEKSDECDEDSGESDEEDESEDDDESDSTDEGFEDSTPSKGNLKRRETSENVEDGRTLFFRNLSFETDEETFREAMSEFGDIIHCKIVINPKTERPRGTGFAKFKNTEAADACLNKADDQGGGIILDGRKLLVAKAVTREKASGFQKKEKPKRDKRNLHLVREGLIRAGTKDAEGLSKDDLAKRQKLEKSKRVKLKNPSIFVSTTRLCVHNIPKYLDEKELKKIYRKAGGQHAKVTECRIMRDMASIDAKGVGKSRGYGFINFTEHDHAIQALKDTNNNPDLFKDKTRLIVEFSLENKTALLAKEKRRERFQARQKHLKTEDKSSNTNIKEENSKERRSQKRQQKNKQKDKLTDKFIGNVPVPEGKNIKNVLPSHWGPKVRHKSRPQVQPSKHKQTARPEKRKFEKGKGPVKQEKKKKLMVDNFDQLVNSYKQKIMSSKSSSKWFDN